MKKSYVSPKIEPRESKIGKGLFTKEKILKDELIIDFSAGPGRILPIGDEESYLFNEGYDYMIQAGENELFAATNSSELEEADFINHSCDPNCGIKGSLKIVATRDIEPGEEITFDYAMSESTQYSIDCKCGSSNCRKKITGNDWKILELQEKYKGYFSDYLQKKINALN